MTPRSILVIRLTAIGDVIRTLPAVSALRRTWPRARIGWLVEEPAREILEAHPDVDQVHVLRRRLLRGALTIVGTPAAAAHLKSILGEIRRDAYEWTVDFQGTIKSATLARLSRAKKTFGLGAGHAREQSHVFYSDPIPLPRGEDGRMSRVERALALARGMGADTSNPRTILPEMAGRSEKARAFLDRSAPGRPRIVIYPGSSEAQAHKRWPASHFARFADQMAERSGGTVLIGWGPGEERMAEEIRSAMKHPAVLTPPTSLADLAEIIRRCDLFAGSDTGPLHLAAATGIPLVAIYGPTDEVVNAPYTDAPHEAFTGDVACRPCRNRGCQNVSCLRRIQPDDLARRAAQILARTGRSTGSAAGIPGA